MRVINNFNAEKHYIDKNSKILLIPECISTFNKSNILCSIIIPCFNYGKYLKESVQSALKQTLASKEIIIVNDGSTDPYTINELISIVKKNRVQVLFKQNEGLVSARNAGIGAAKGKYICCLDADDILLPSYIEHCVFELESNPVLGFVYSWVKLFGDVEEIWETHDFEIEEALQENWTSVSAVFRKADWLLAGKYDNRMENGFEDWEFWLRLWQLGRGGKTIRQALFLHRRHGFTMTHTAYSKKEKIVNQIRQYNERLYKYRSVRECILQHINDNKDKIHYPRKLSSLVKMNRKGYSKICILVVLPWLKPGGAEVLMIDILRGLKDDFDFTIITTIADEHLLENHFRELTQEIFHYQPQDGSPDLISFISYLVETRDIKMTIVSGSRSFYDALQKFKKNYPHIPVVDILHNDSELGYIAISAANTEYIRRHICVSNTIRQSIISKGVHEHKAVAIPNGIDVHNLFRARIKNRTSIRKEFGINDSRPVIGFVGRAFPEKRPILYLEIIKRLKSLVNPFGLCVSSGIMLKDMEKFIYENNLTQDIFIINEIPRESIWKIYAACDMLVNVSSIEGLPLTVIEALSTGCPVAAMQVGHLDALISDGENGLLVPKDELNMLIEKISLSICNRKKMAEMRRRAREKILSSVYNSKDMIKGYNAIVNEMIGYRQIEK